MAIELILAPYGLKNEKACLPNKTQQKVLDWVDSVRRGEHKKSGIPVLYLQGGVGAGKTRALLAPVLEMLFEIPNLRVLWGREDFNDLKKSAVETFLEVLPQPLLFDKNEQYHWYDIKQNAKYKARLYFSGLKDLSGLGSQEFGVAVVTEVHEITLSAYRTIKQRVRQAGMPTMILMEGNPPNKGHWLQQLTDKNNAEYDPDIEMWEISTYENWDNLPLNYRHSLETMPLSWRNKYLFGKFGFTPDGKPFYSGYVERIHKRKLCYSVDKIIYRSWDYGFHHPACTFHTIDAKGRWLILREVMGQEVTIDKFGQYILTLCKEWFPKAKFEDFGDPAGNQKSDKDEKTSVEILASMGIYVTSKSSTYRTRKEIIERKLATLIDGIPALVVDDSCQIVNDGFLGGYHYPVRKQGQPFDPKKFEVPFRDSYYEHCLNSVEYFAVNMFEGAETKKDTAVLTTRVVGDLKDVQIRVEDEENNYARYRQTSTGVMIEGEDEDF